jgi:hypothetical protein
MRRAALLGVTAALVALAAAAPAGADLPPVHGGSVLGRNLPLKVYASVTPAVHTFGDAITARVAVLADRRWVAPANLRTIVHFAPYEAAGPPAVTRTSNGRLLQMTWTWKLRCLTAACLPITKTKTDETDLTHIFRFSPAHVEYLSPQGQVRYSVDAFFQRVAVLSELSPDEVNALEHQGLIWYYQSNITPVSAPHYRVSPDRAFWLAVALAAVLGAAGLFLAGRWALQFRPARAAKGAAESSSLERALTLFFWARANNDETLQRKALERVADELPFDVHELSETARALAWSPETPEGEDVEEISERAGIHRRNGEGEL